jgi:hypothetical protein
MTATIEPATADGVYTADVEPRRRDRLGRLAAGALDLWCAMSGGHFDLTNEGVVVVRRRRDGGLELRVPAGAPEASAVLLEVVRRQLETLTPEEFREGWGIA